MATTNYVKVDGAWIESSTFGATDAQVLLITSAQLTADSANQTALAASQLAGSASSAVSTAVTNASNANAAIIDISSDGKLTPLEKSVVRKDWDMISGEKSVLDSQATNYSITTEKTTYDAAWQSLATYLNAGSTWVSGIPSWINDTNILLTTTVTKATMRSTFATYFNAKIALLKKVSDEAKRIADAAKQAAIDADAKAVTAGGTAVWSGVSGTGRPADGATRNVHQGVYSSSSAYLVGDMVTSSSGEGWSCYVATTGNAPPTSSSTTYNTWWKLMSGGGVTASLSKDTIAIASDSTGYVSNFTGIPTVTMSIYIGGSDDSANWTCACTYSNCNTPEASSNKSQTISSFQTAFDNGSITFTASKTGFSNVVKILSVTKSKSGSAGSPSTVAGPAGKTTERIYQINTSSTSPSNYPASSGASSWTDTVTSTVSSGNFKWQCDGIYDPSLARSTSYPWSNPVWGTPYLTLFQVGTLEALSVKTGSLVSAIGTGGSRLSINEASSHQFAVYSDSGYFVSSIGDYYGVLMPKHKGIWNNSVTYTNGDYVTYNNYIYKAQSNPYAGAAPTDLTTNTYWYFYPDLSTRVVRRLAETDVSGYSSLLQRSITYAGLVNTMPDDVTLQAAKIAATAAGKTYTNSKMAGFKSGSNAYDDQVLVHHKRFASSVQLWTDGFYFKFPYVEGEFGRYTSNISTSITQDSTTEWGSRVKKIKFTDAVTSSGYFFETYCANNNAAIEATYGQDGSGTYVHRALLCDGINAVKAEGNITSSGNITAYDGSDRRIKENIMPIWNPLEKLSLLSGNTFKWTQDYYDKQDKEFFKEFDVGVIAQEVQQVLPEAVHIRKDGILSVDYKKIIPLLIEAINAQQKQIKELRNDIARLS